MKPIPYSVLAVTVLTAISAGGLFLYFQPDLDSGRTLQPLQLISAVSAQDLILQQVTFDIITKATLDEAGNPVLYFASAGMFGKGASKIILFKGCLQIRYGIRLDGLIEKSCSINNGVLTLDLPAPQIIGDPVILTDSSCESRILDIQGEGWWAGYVQKAKVQTQIHQAYIKNAPSLCESLGIEQKTKERAEHVIEALLLPVLKGQNLKLFLRWPEEKFEPETTTPEGGADANAGPETNAFDTYNPGDGDGTLALYGPLVRNQLPFIATSFSVHQGCPGDVTFDFAAEPVCRVSDGTK